MEGGSNGTSCMMAFGENSTTNNGVVVSPMMTMMPLMSPSNSSSHTHHHHHHHHQHSHHSPNPNTDTVNALMSPLFLPLPPLTTHHHHHQSHNNNNISSSSTSTYNLNMGGEISNSQDSGNNISSFKAKIMAHPHYHRLLASYLNCQKVGAPPEVVARLEAACRTVSAASGHVSRGCLGEDPALDQFMEAYCEMLCKYALELSKPFNEAMLFLQRIDSQFKSLTVSSSDSACGEGMMDRNGSSEEEVDVNNSLIDPLAEDRELKGQLLRRYSGYLGSLKQEFMKKRKKGKLPKEARQQLLDWWSRHYKWPYPSESQKVALAESTGLDQKQINNWFINQRKRHWKPSEDMQFVVMDAAAHPHHYYMDNLLGNPFPMDISSTML